MLWLVLGAVFSIGLLSGQEGFAGGTKDYFCSFRVMAYYPDYFSWQVPISTLRFDRLSRVIYFSIYPNADGSLNTSEISLSRQEELVAAAHGHEVKVSICVGGWGLSGHFSAMAANTPARANFVGQMVQYCRDYALDGVNLDWEPVSTTADRNNYSLLISEFKDALMPDGKTLSVAVFALGSEFTPSVIDKIDWLNVMAYDMGTPHSTYEGAIAALDHWVAFGFEKSKINLGMPFYGRNAAGEYFAYKDIVAQFSPAPDQDQAGGIYFNGRDTIRRKTHYVMTNGYGGIMFWDLTGDTLDGTSLLRAASDEVLLSGTPDYDCDAKIGNTDFGAFGSGWLRTECASDNVWCGRSDLNQSGGVDMADFELLFQFWLNMK